MDTGEGMATAHPSAAFESPWHELPTEVKDHADN